MLACFINVTRPRLGKTYRLLAALALTISLSLVATEDSAHADDAAPQPPAAPFKLPTGTRWVAAEGRYAVTSGLAEATRAIEKQLAKLGIACERIGPYRVRGVEVTRFLSQQPSTSWLAIHLVRKEGRTFLDVIDRIPLTNAAATR